MPFIASSEARIKTLLQKRFSFSLKIISLLLGYSFFVLANCPEDLAWLKTNPSFSQLALRVFGPSIQNRIEEKVIHLTSEDVQDLFKDVEDASTARIGRFILARMRSKNMTIDVVEDPNDTGYAAGTCWSGSCDHNIQALLVLHLMGGNPGKHGIRATVRGIIVHEAMHARIAEYRAKWLKAHGIDSAAWSKTLHTATEEYLARLAEQKAIGNTGAAAKVRAWFATLIDGAEVAKPWTDLETEWKNTLRKKGVVLKEGDALKQELESQRIAKERALARDRERTESSLRRHSELNALHNDLIKRKKITEDQWRVFETSLVEGLYRRFGGYAEHELTKFVEQKATELLNLNIKAHYSTNTIYSFNLVPE